jgi:hypothetical protein
MRHFVLVFLIACGGSKATPAPPAPPKDPIPASVGPDCQTVAAHAVPVLFADRPDAHAAAIEAYQTRCETDAWSDEARNCISTIQNADEAKGCETHLTDAQRKALEAAVAGI